MRAACSAAVAFALLSLAAAADCADDTCSAGQDQEEAALLQRVATRANTTETTTLTCYPNQATGTCGNPSLPCFLDITGCSASGGGSCCKAAGNGAGLQQCRFCNCNGENLCAGFPSPTPQPTPSPTPAPTPTPPSGGQGVGQQCGSASSGYFYGNCQSGLTCYRPPNAAPGAHDTCVQVCRSDFSNSATGMSACSFGGSCGCYAPTPCRGWAGECIQFCSNTRPTANQPVCFWPGLGR